MLYSYYVAEYTHMFRCICIYKYTLVDSIYVYYRYVKNNIGFLKGAASVFASSIGRCHI